MEQFPITDIEACTLFQALKEIPEPPPSLRIRGSIPKDTIFLTVVGARNMSSYGVSVCRELIMGLKGFPITIISGLARGIDTVAHESALEVGLCTVALPGSGLDSRVLYPKENRTLAERILHAGGALISEYRDTQRPAPWTFPRRNRLLAGISAMVLVIEAGPRSGTLITARLGLEYNRSVGAVPGDIRNILSYGPHALMRQGAAIITSANDIVEELGYAYPKKIVQSVLNIYEEKVYEVLSEPYRKEDIIAQLSLPRAYADLIFISLQEKGYVKEIGGFLQRIA